MRQPSWLVKWDAVFSVLLGVVVLVFAIIDESIWLGILGLFLVVIGYRAWNKFKRQRAET